MRSPLVFCLFTRLVHFRARLCHVVLLATFVGRPFTHVHPSGSCVLNVWKRVVSIHSSESKTSLSLVMFSVCSEALSMYGLVGLMTSTHSIGMKKVVSSGQLCPMYFVMAMCEITRSCSEHVYRVLFEKSVLFFIFICRVGVEGIEEFERSVCKWKQQLSFCSTFWCLKTV